MRTIAAVIVVMMMLTSAAAAQVLTLSCDGTKKSVLLGSDDTPEKISNEGAVVNLDEGTVTLLGFTSAITKSGAVFVEFRGRGADKYMEGWSILGGLDRITGALWAEQSLASKEDKLRRVVMFDLLCKRVRPLF